MTLELSSLQPSCADLLHRSDLSITVRAQLPELQTSPPDLLRQTSQALLRPILHLVERCLMTLELSSLQPSCADLLHRSDLSITVKAQLPELQTLPPEFLR